MGGEDISAADPHQRQRVSVLDTEISNVDTGTGDPTVFLHGNPTSSYLWRNIIPYVSRLGRCLAPDLVGMGQSEPSPRQAYRFIDHARYLDAWFETLGLTRNIILVLHDWGSALGFYRAFRHPEQVKAIAYMEAILYPRRWSDFPNGRDAMFRAMRSPQGERLVLDENFFIETVLPESIIRQLNEPEMEAYRAPFRDRGSRLPMLIWPRELPIEGEPADVVAIVKQYSEWLSKSDLPKLLIAAEPGSILVGRALEFCRRWPNQREVKVSGIHFVQEDSPAEIGTALQGFIAGLGATSLTLSRPKSEAAPFRATGWSSVASDLGSAVQRSGIRDSRPHEGDGAPPVSWSRRACHRDASMPALSARRRVFPEYASRPQLQALARPWRKRCPHWPRRWQTLGRFS